MSNNVNGFSENLPSTRLKRLSVLDYFKTAIQSKSEIKKTNEIIEELGKIKEYDVLSMQSFRHVVGSKIEKNKNGSLVMADINNLYEANKFSSKEKVNKDIKNIMDQIKEIIKKSNVEEFDIGKLGDEIYLYLPNVGEEKTSFISQEIKEIKENMLSLSLGQTSNLEHGIHGAMQDAESRMYEDKVEYKHNLLMDFCKGDPSKVIEYAINREITKSRLDLDSLRDKSKQITFFNIFDRVVNNIENIDEIIESAKNNESDSAKVANDYKKLENRYRKEANIKLKNADETIKEKYVLAQFLSRGKVDGTVTKEYFEAFEKKDLKNKKKMAVLGLDISGLKYVNDTYGHDAGDAEIEKILETLKNNIKEQNIKTHSDIVIKGAGNAIVILDNIKEEQKSNLLSSISNVESELDVSCLISDFREYKKELKGKNGIEIFETLRNKNEENLDKISLERKITDERKITRLISGIYENVFKNSVIQCSIQKGGLNDSDLINEVNSKFINIVKDSGKKSNIVNTDDRSRQQNISMDLEEKEKLNSKEKDDYESIENI